MPPTSLQLRGSKLVQLSLSNSKGKGFRTLQTPPCDLPVIQDPPASSWAYGALGLLRQERTRPQRITKCLLVRLRLVTRWSSSELTEGSPSKGPGGADNGNPAESFASLCTFLSFKDSSQDGPDWPNWALQPFLLWGPPSLEWCHGEAEPQCQDRGPMGFSWQNPSPKSTGSSLVWEWVWDLAVLAASLSPASRPLTPPFPSVTFPSARASPSVFSNRLRWPFHLKPPNQPETSFLFPNGSRDLIFSLLSCSKTKEKIFFHVKISLNIYMQLIDFLSIFLSSISSEMWFFFLAKAS